MPLIEKKKFDFTFTSGHGLVNLSRSAILAGGINIDREEIIGRVMELEYRL